MSDQFIGEIRMFAGTFAPVNWAFCDGTIMSISQNPALYSILGIIYGGDGRSTFALPDLRGRAPMQWGSGPTLTPRTIGQFGGQDTVTLTVANMPAHTHTLSAYNGRANVSSPKDALMATSSSDAYYTADPAPAPNTTMDAQSISLEGGGNNHLNIQPVLCVNFIIALQGLFPSRN